MMAKLQIVCPPPCGHAMSAPDEPQLIRIVQEHATTVHGHDLAPEEVRQLIARHASKLP